MDDDGIPYEYKHEIILRDYTPSKEENALLSKYESPAMEIFNDSWGYCQSDTCRHVSHDPYQEFLSTRICTDELLYIFSDKEVSIILVDRIYIYRCEPMDLVDYHYYRRPEYKLKERLSDAIIWALTNYNEYPDDYEPKKQLLELLFKSWHPNQNQNQTNSE